ncbi:MAG: alpha-amylase family glycosyl hydrolase [Thermoflexales bacterium]|nr:alpha-amylase family glycosyl hydrolase [Thermoflexales bacterium]
MSNTLRCRLARATLVVATAAYGVFNAHLAADAHVGAEPAPLASLSGDLAQPNSLASITARDAVVGSGYQPHHEQSSGTDSPSAFFSPQSPAQPPSTIDWVGRMWPRGGVANLINQGNFAPANFNVYIQVYEPGVTDSPGQGPGISCFLHWGRYGDPWQDLPMVYNPTPGPDVSPSNDEYYASISKSVIESLAPGTYGFTAYCQKPGEDKKWKVDTYNINGNPADDDQGDGLITIVPSGDPRPAPPAGVFVHLFEWRWADIQKECAFLAQKGYRGVQVSPPQEHIVPTANMLGNPANAYPWWVRYQPVSYTLQSSRSGTLAEFQSMVSTCNSYGVDIIVDAVINHMTGLHPDTATSTGTAGTVFSHYNYPGLFGPSDFNYCGTNPSATNGDKDNINDYTDRLQVQTCELLNLADLKTSSASVRARIANYLQSLVNMGVKGFRIDAAKHIPAHELGAILSSISGTFYVFNEVIDVNSAERVRALEYSPYGDVTEFYYSMRIGEIFNNCSGSNLSQLQNFPLSHWIPSRFAVVFTDNHDNQRGHGAGGTCIVDHRDGAAHILANVFALAHPYGDYVSVMSSYYWSNNPSSSAGDSKGPPSTTPPYTSGSGPDTRPVYGAGQGAGDWPANCNIDAFEDGKWVCEHRRPATAGMVGFRAAVHGEPITRWVNVSSNHITFGRGNKGYVAINRTNVNNTRTYTTSLPSGYYCDVTRYAFVNGWCVDYFNGSPLPLSQWVAVNAAGEIVNHTVNAMDAFAVHIGASRHGISLNVTPATGGSVVGSGTYLYNQTATVTATAQPGYTFVRWEDASGPLTTAPVYTFPVTSNRVLTAVFAASSHAQVVGNSADTRKTVSPTTTTLGQVVTYTIVLSNPASFATIVFVTDTLPSGMSFVGVVAPTPAPTVQSGQVLAWHSVTVPPNSLVTLVFRVQVNTTGTLTNTFVVGDGQNEVPPAGGTQPLIVGMPSGTISDLNNSGTRKEVTPTTVRMGERVTYTITLSNTGSATVTAQVTDTLPLSTTLISATPGYVQSGQTLSWSNVSVPPGGSAVLTITVQVGSGALPNGYALTNTVEVGALGGTLSRVAPTVTVHPWRAFVPITQR